MDGILTGTTTTKQIALDPTTYQVWTSDESVED